MAELAIRARAPKPKRNVDCGHCGKAFQTYMPTAIYCTDRCQKAAQGMRGIAKASKCEGCGKVFHPKRSDRLRFCSRQCTFLAQKAGKALSVERIIWPRTPVWCVYCERCNNPVVAKTAKKLCASCVGSKLRTCRTCTAQLSRGEHRCPTCRRAHLKGARKVSRQLHGRLNKHRRRARKYGVPYEAIDPLAIFNRDSWQCQICGCDTPRALRGSYESRAPELDHIIPISKGGPHISGNLQCACRRCNGLKGASLMPSMGVVGST